MDLRSELLVCPISGQTTDRLVHEWEEEDEGGRCGGGAGGVGEEEGGLGVFAGEGLHPYTSSLLLSYSSRSDWCLLFGLVAGLVGVCFRSSLQLSISSVVG